MTKSEKNTLTVLQDEAKMTIAKINAIQDHEYEIRKLFKKLTSDLVSHRLKLHRINQSIEKIRLDESYMPQGNFDKMQET